MVRLLHLNRIIPHHLFFQNKKFLQHGESQNPPKTYHQISHQQNLGIGPRSLGPHQSPPPKGLLDLFKAKVIHFPSGSTHLTFQKLAALRPSGSAWMSIMVSKWKIFGLFGGMNICIIYVYIYIFICLFRVYSQIRLLCDCPCLCANVYIYVLYQM